MIEYPEYIQRAINSFSKLPGIGHKTAVRLTMNMINKDIADVEDFCSSILNSRRNLKYCSKCKNFSEGDLCFVCIDKSRDHSTICVVQDVRDLYAFEKTKTYRGVYYVLHGVITPIKGIGPSDIGIDFFEMRVKSENIKEIILATSPTLEGEATSIYLSKLFNNENIKITRLAYGIPLGSDLEYVDEVTLGRALDSRLQI